MIDCDFAPGGPLWVCRQCGYVFPLASKRPPRRNCPRAPGLADRIMAAVADRHVPGLHLPLEIVRDNVAACVVCEHNRGLCCARVSGGCEGRDRFLTALLYGRCPAGKC